MALREMMDVSGGGEIRKSEGGKETLVGKHVAYKYENGWEYEVYYKTHGTIDYRVKSGMVAGRWVKDQPVQIRRLGPASDCRFMVNWAEPTGTTVCQVVDIRFRRMDTVAYFPHWVTLNPEATVCFQNDNLSRMEALRDAGPIYPLREVSEQGIIHTVFDVGPGDDSVISGTFISIQNSSL